MQSIGVHEHFMSCFCLDGVTQLSLLVFVVAIVVIVVAFSVCISNEPYYSLWVKLFGV